MKAICTVVMGNGRRIKGLRGGQHVRGQCARQRGRQRGRRRARAVHEVKRRGEGAVNGQAGKVLRGPRETTQTRTARNNTGNTSGDSTGMGIEHGLTEFLGKGQHDPKGKHILKEDLRAFAEFSMQALDEERTADAWTGTERGNALHSEVHRRPCVFHVDINTTGIVNSTSLQDVPYTVVFHSIDKAFRVCLPGLLVYALQPSLQLAQEKFWTKV
ncbi:hypothetical protein GGX14DRAFT_404059 [Mycena pura]|uniref:Uncharacterized protein n=1 Tax=Mycena pura TaxID=153505 RepID=A0AAD6V206_9AGAR|nr:hypothetical protein GGX14DRAFT_404059 [Mycena pura]